MAGEDSEIANIALQLASAVQLMMDPNIPQQQRHEAFQRLEQFKESSPVCSQCGLFLTAITHPPVVRHFGLKILEDVIKARWNDMSAEEKLFIKDNLMKLMESGTRHMLEEHNHIKDGLAKIVVELIKREWPQHWPSLLQELDTLCRKGETQTELVQFVLVRLVEDVAVLQTLEQNQRRREIYQALTHNMEEIFRFLLGLLEKHYSMYRDNQLRGENCKVCVSILNTFTSLVEWVNIQHIMANDKYLLRCLTHLLSDPSLQLAAAECLLGVVGWRAGKMGERAQILCLFETEMMAPLFAATEAAERHKMEEQHYNFLKKMVQILTVLGDQVCTLWTKDTPHQVQNLDTYLNALLAFTRHPSQTVNHFANELWVKLFRHPDLASHPVIQSYVVKWVETAVKRCVKVGYPTRTDDPSCAYSLLDFDTDEEFVSFFVKYKLCIVDIVKQITQKAPTMILSYLDVWIRSILSGDPINLVHLEAIPPLLDATFSKLLTPSQLSGLSPTGVQLLKLFLEHPTKDPLILSELLSCISALFSLVVDTPDALNPILSKILSSITYPVPSDQYSPGAKQVRTLRRHGCALLVKLSTKFPAALLPAFPFLRSEIDSLSSRNLLSKMEVVTLVEALIILSNEFGDYEREASFIKEICAPVVVELASLEAAYCSVDAFVAHIGLDRAPVDNIANGADPAAQNRAQLSGLINFLLAVFRRADVPADKAQAVSGGFQVVAGSRSVMRNPAGGPMAQLLRNLLILGQTVNKLFSPDVKNKIDPGLAKALDILDADKNNVLGLPGSRTVKNELTYQLRVSEPVTKMQTFITELFENVLHLLAHFCTNIGYEFYHQPELVPGLCQSIFSNLAGLPDFRLRAINRMFLKNFINKCPVELYEPVLLPVLVQICPYMFTRLQERWNYLAKVRESPSFDEDNTDSQEVLDDVIIRVTAREYLDSVRAILTSEGKEVPSSGGGEAEAGNNNNSVVVTELGMAALRDPALGQALMLTLLRGLNWRDSVASCRAAALVELVVPKMILAGALGADDAANVMICVLSAFQEMGMHENNNIALTHLALACYENLRPNFPNIVDVLAQVPGCQQEDLTKFDSRIMAGLNPNVKTGDKAKKDMFKKMITQLIGKDVARMFQKEIVIKNLPSLKPTKIRDKTPSLDEQTDKSGADFGLSGLLAQNGST